MTSKASSSCADVSSASLAPCTWCGRATSFPNPIPVGKYAKCEHLPFVRGHENACVPCKNYLTLSWFAKCKTSKDLREELAKPQNREAFVQGLEQYEELYRESYGAGKRVQKGAVAELKFCKQVTTEQESRLKFEKVIGVHWPLDVYEATFGKKPDPSQTTSLGGEEGEGPGLGVVLPEASGCPAGCTRITQEWSKAARQVQRLADSREALREGTIESAWGVAQKMANAISFADNKNDAAGPMHVTVRPGPAPDKRPVHASDDSSSEDIDYLYAADRHAGKSKPAKRARTARAASAPTATGSSGKAGGSVSAPGGGGRGMRQYNAIVVAQNLAVEAEHVISTAQNDATFATLTIGQVQSKLQGLTKKLDPPSRTLLCSPQHGFVFTTAGGKTIQEAELMEMAVAVVAQMELAQSRLAAIKNVVQAFQARRTPSGKQQELKDATLVDAAALLEAIDEATSAGVRIPLCVRKEVIERHITRCAAGDDFGGIAVALDISKDGSNPMTIGAVCSDAAGGSEAVSKLAQQIILSKLHEFFRVDRAPDRLAMFVTACAALEVKLPNLFRELNLLEVMIQAQTSSAQALREAYSHFKGDGDGTALLSKVCWVLPLGVHLMSSASTALESHETRWSLMKAAPAKERELKEAAAKVEELLPNVDSGAQVPRSVLVAAAKRLQVAGKDWELLALKGRGALGKHTVCCIHAHTVTHTEPQTPDTQADTRHQTASARVALSQWLYAGANV